MSAAADDNNVVARLGIGVAPGPLPAFVIVEAVFQEAEE
jgi:hypothetical protein